MQTVIELSPEKKGAINGIWLTRPSGDIHPAILPNISSWIRDAKSTGFEIILWTNTKDIERKKLMKFVEDGILIRDYSLCKQSKFYDYFLYFLDMGMNGDNVAFALASDILRMSIMELWPEDKFYVYADFNDVKFTDLQAELENMEIFRTNPLGFSYLIYENDKGKLCYGYDVLVAKKNKNRVFFEAFFNKYEKNLMEKCSLYMRPSNKEQAVKLAREITVATSFLFFKITKEDPKPYSLNIESNFNEPYYRQSFEKPLKVNPTFMGNFVIDAVLCNSYSFLRYSILTENAGTWYPEKGFQPRNF